MTKPRHSLLFIIIVMMLFSPIQNFAEAKKKEKHVFDIPKHVLSISKENTFPNIIEDQEIFEPSKLTKELLDELDIKVENPELIKLLNETSLKPSPVAVGYRGMVYLGRWPLNYQSDETTVNWEYQQINTNELNNYGSDQAQEIRYFQNKEKEVNGALTNKVAQPEQVKSMILRKVKEKSKLPLSFQTVIGANTKKENYYNVPVKKTAILYAYAPAVNEKGHVTFGEVYIQLKGSKKYIVIENITKQGVGAWIPIQDYLSFSFQVK